VYSLADFRESYYQQRFNQTETDESPLVDDLFSNRRLIQLSSGELRKLLIHRILQEKPKMLIFDNPFIGLDAPSREQLENTFAELHQQGVILLFLVPSKNDLPKITNKIFELVEPHVRRRLQPTSDYQTRLQPCSETGVSPDISDAGRTCAEQRTRRSVDATPNNGRTCTEQRLLHFVRNDEKAAEIVVKMENITINYGDEIIQENINWTIKRGEKWALLGRNGSGKSTLLSYIFADNPQAYSKQLTLFDHPRGTGESIWDIKKRIGFTSSEMHLYYRENVSGLKVVESGFFDSIGLFRKCTDEQAQLAEHLLETLNIRHLIDTPFLKMSSGEQRMILFARSLVKNPELLILDEPFHGLDDENKQRCLQVVEEFGKQPDKSLIFVTHRQEEIPAIVEHFYNL
jgi:molybdate transport system ATP-binding protein